MPQILAIKRNEPLWLGTDRVRSRSQFRPTATVIRVVVSVAHSPPLAVVLFSPHYRMAWCQRQGLTPVLGAGSPGRTRCSPCIYLIDGNLAVAGGGPL